jgi:hypothetical protein
MQYTNLRSGCNTPSVKNPYQYGWATLYLESGFSGQQLVTLASATEMGVSAMRTRDVLQCTRSRGI